MQRNMAQEQSPAGGSRGDLSCLQRTGGQIRAELRAVTMFLLWFRKSA